MADNLNALRVKPATTPTQRVDDFGVRVDPETRLHQHLDYFGTHGDRVRRSRGRTTTCRSTSARASRRPRPPEPPEAPWPDLEAPSYRAAAGEFLLLERTSPDALALDELVGALARRDARWPPCAGWST